MKRWNFLFNSVNIACCPRDAVIFLLHTSYASVVWESFLYCYFEKPNLSRHCLLRENWCNRFATCPLEDSLHRRFVRRQLDLCAQNQLPQQQQQQLLSLQQQPQQQGGMSVQGSIVGNTGVQGQQIQLSGQGSRANPSEGGGGNNLQQLKAMLEVVPFCVLPSDVEDLQSMLILCRCVYAYHRIHNTLL